jgi:hypothetical protein
VLDLANLAPAGRRLYAQSLAGALASGHPPVQAEQIAEGALKQAGFIRVAKSAEVRVMKRLEVVKAKPELADEIGQDNADAVRFMELYRARRSSNPKKQAGEVHLELAAEYPQLATAYRNHVTG